jgi:hypothetical protein
LTGGSPWRGTEVGDWKRRFLTDCKQRCGEAACYVSADGDDRGTMGRGSQARADHAEPWRRAASIFTGVAKDQWAVSLGRVMPHPL